MAANRVNKINRQNNLIDLWIGTHADHEQLQAITGLKRTGSASPDQNTAKNEIMRLAADMRKLGRRST